MNLGPKKMFSDKKKYTDTRNMTLTEKQRLKKSLLKPVIQSLMGIDIYNLNIWVVRNSILQMGSPNSLTSNPKGISLLPAARLKC